MSTENEYVATALAEKRLREVLNDRLPQDSSVVDALAVVLLDGAEIEYLPRKKAVSIRLRIPETATTPSTSKVLRQDGSDPTDIGEALVTNSSGTSVVPESEIRAELELPHDRGVAVAAPGTVGRFEPKMPAIFNDDEFFTE